MMFTPGWTCSICGEATVYEPNFQWATFMHLECYSRYYPTHGPDGFIDVQGAVAYITPLGAEDPMELVEFSTRHLDAIPQD